MRWRGVKGARCDVGHGCGGRFIRTEAKALGQVKDEVSHPQHYSRWEMEPIEFIAINDLPWWLSNLIKYTMRYDAKDGLQDLYKGRSYLDMKIRQMEEVPRFWDKPVTEERKLNGGTRPQQEAAAPSSNTPGS